MTSVLYLGCPAPERADAEQRLGAVDVSVVWGEGATFAVTELQRRNMPVLLDLSQGGAALEIAQEIRTQRASTLMFAVVDARRPDLTTEAVLAGLADVFARPLGGRLVANAIERELKYQARETIPPSLANEDALYGHSTAMREVMALIARAGAGRCGVLIRGEAGTGRQTAARAIHNHRPGAGAFVTVDCAERDGEALDAELFGTALRDQNGHREFTGLEQISQDALLYHARGGTIYLRNVADAPTRVQARLARLLRDREAIVTETGEAASVDVRPMAGVDPGFDVAVQDGRVHEDLYRRLSGICIEMPALRHRREDIPVLTNYFVREQCARIGVPPKPLARSALSLLSALPWRGNGAELRQLLDAVVSMMPAGRGIAMEDILAHVKLDGSAVSFPANGGTLKEARSRFEKEYIAAVLDQHRGRMGDAARTLGIQRTNLYRKMRALNVLRSRKA